MYFNYIVILSCVYTITNTHAANSNVQASTPKKNNANNKEQVIPARYKFKNNKSSFDPANVDLLDENFPEMEYPRSVIESTKPFYMNSNPFSNDVTHSFKKLASGGKTKGTPTIVLNVRADETNTSKVKSETLEAPGSGTNATAVDEESESNLKGPNKTETKFIEPIKHKESPDALFANDSLEEEEVEIIEDLEKLITELVEIETEVTDINNTTANIFNTEPLNEFKSITSDVLSENNESTELNQSSLHTELVPNVVESNDTLASESLFSDENSTLTSSFNDTGVVLDEAWEG